MWENMHYFHTTKLSKLALLSSLTRKNMLARASIMISALNKAILEPRVSPAFAIYFCNHCNIRFGENTKYVDTLTLFSKNLNQRSLTPRWPLTPCLLRSHVWLYPRIIVSKSHDNSSMYVDTVINFAKYHIHTYIHTSYILHTYYVQNEWSHSLLLNSVQARQKAQPSASWIPQFPLPPQQFTLAPPWLSDRIVFWRRSSDTLPASKCNSFKGLPLESHLRGFAPWTPTLYPLNILPWCCPHM